MDAAIGRGPRLAALAAIFCLVGARSGAQDAPPAPRAPATLLPTPMPLVIPPPTQPTSASPTPQSPPLPPPDAMAPIPDVAEDKPKPRVIVPAGPPTPVRAPSAVLRVLDKVTAETMAFDAPVGRRVRYKSLVVEVKACETRDLTAPEPQPSAYLVVTSDAGMGAGPTLGPRQVFKGWMFANAPSLHALKHPVYDLWLVACSAATPST